MDSEHVGFNQNKFFQIYISHIRDQGNEKLTNLWCYCCMDNHLDSFPAQTKLSLTIAFANFPPTVDNDFDELIAFASPDSL